MTKLLPVNRGLWTLVDDEDYEQLRGFKWFVNGQDYPYRTIRLNGKNKNLRLHRLLSNAPDGLEVDHINGDPLDNRRANLRIVNRSQNLQNRRGATARSKTGVRGVYLTRDSRANPYAAALRVRGKTINLGYFPALADAEAAVKAARALLMTHSAESTVAP